MVDEFGINPINNIKLTYDVEETNLRKRGIDCGWDYEFEIGESVEVWYSKDDNTPYGWYKAKINKFKKWFYQITNMSNIELESLTTNQSMRKLCANNDLMFITRTLSIPKK